ncbi:MAG: FG-GAP repeat protein, partial [Acidobacteriota bacterium]
MRTKISPHSNVGPARRPSIIRGRPAGSQPARSSCPLWLAASLVWLAAAPLAAQLIAEDRAWIPGFSERSRHGEALATGDFNGDGFDDLAVGSPLLDWSTFDDSGFVRLHFGGPEGITSTGAANVTFRESSLLGGQSGTGDRFGATLASADFDLDGFDDLAVGIPGKTIDGDSNAGRVAVVYGLADVGLDFTRAVFFDQDVLEGEADWSERFGWALAAGRLGSDSYPDLVIGSPGEVVGGFLNAGAVHVVLSDDATGLQPAGNVLITQDTPNAFGIASPGDRFGSAFALGDVTGDGDPDLLVGSPGDWVNGEQGCGSVQMFPGG